MDACIVAKFINPTAKVALRLYCSLDKQTFQAVIMGPSGQGLDEKPTYQNTFRYSESFALSEVLL